MLVHLATALTVQAHQKLGALAGEEEYWVMFKEAYTAAVRYYKAGPWYHNADIWSGLPTQQQTTSLQAFWPGAPHLLPCLALEERAGEAFAPIRTVQELWAMLLRRHLLCK